MHCKIKKRYHLIGIGGIGMSGLASLLYERGHEVSGSDLTANSLTETLKTLGVKVWIGHDAKHLPEDATVIYNTDIRESNPEYAQAKLLGCPLLHRSEMLANLMHEKSGLAVTGTHGKTTTSSLLAWVLHRANKTPSFCIGGILPAFSSNAKSGEGEYFVAEADESDSSFLKYHPEGAIITNIDFDHMDHFKQEKQLLSAFGQFLAQVKRPDLLFWCGDDPLLASLKPSGVSYGRGPGNLCRGSAFRQEGWKSFFDVEYEGEHHANIELNAIGEHNMLNATAVFGLGLRLGIDPAQIREGLKTFCGVKRRVEMLGEHASILFLDDYGHHPNEIITTLQGIKTAIGKRRLVVAFQPHRYTRTRDCWNEFATAFGQADELILTDIYTAGELPIPGIDALSLLKEIWKQSDVRAKYLPYEEIAAYLLATLHPMDVVVTVGAGSITKIGPSLLEKMRDVP